MFLYLLGIFLDFVSFFSALYISSLIATEKTSFKEYIKKATYTSLTILFVMRACQLVIPPQYALFTGIIFILAFGYAVKYFYKSGEWLGIFLIALLIGLILMVVTAAVLAVLRS